MSKEPMQLEEREDGATPVRRTSLPRKTGSRLRRFFLRHVPLAVGAITLLAAGLLVEVYFYASSDSFQNKVREQLAASLSNATGGRVEIGTFHWRLLSLQAEAGGVVIHGREAADEAPYARIAHLRAKVSVLGILSPSVRLSDLDIERPEMHFIVYPDGTTNQPEPRRKTQATEPAMDRLFDLKAGHVAVENGAINYDDRAAAFDFQSRMVPLNFDVDDVSLRLNYVAATAAAPENYQIELGATDLMLVRGTGKTREPEVHGRVLAMLELARSRATIRQMVLSSRDGRIEHVVQVSGTLEDFARPHWQAAIEGELDMRLLEPALGYPFAPEGIAHLKLAARGAQGSFSFDGPVHIDGGAYVGTGVVARGITLDARVHADEDRLLIDQVVARFKAGGQMEGTVDLHHWVPPPTERPRLVASPDESWRGPAKGKAAPHGPVFIQAPHETVPVDGKVTTKLENLPLDTLLDMVSQAPFQRLGIDSLLNGAADATWTKGDNDSVVVSTDIAMSPSSRAVSGEWPGTGQVDATYTQKDGAVEVRRLDLALPASTIEASGRLGAYPMTSATSLTVNFHSHKLEEFDTVLRDLGLEHAGRAGAEALPAKLTGQADFSGSWTGSLLRPRIAGNVKATQLSLELPAIEGAPRFVSFDSADAAGSYSDERIAIDRVVLTRGAARLTMNGTLDAATVVPAAQIPRSNGSSLPGPQVRGTWGTQLTFDRDSVLHANVQAEQVGVDDLQPFVAAKLPVTGTIDAGFEAHGPLGALEGSGSAQLASGTLYGQPVARVRARGTLDHSTLTLSAVNATVASGSISGTGSYDFATRRFEATAQGTGVEIAQLKWIRSQGTSVAGKLGISVSGAGTRDDPRMEAQATVQGLTIGGEALGTLNATAHTADHAVHYDVKTQLAGAELALNGQTDLRGDNETDNRLEFTKFDVGALLKLAHVNGISGESALAGTVTFAGPLKRMQQMHGEARLEQLAVTLAGVHLTSDGGAHATLADGRVHLDPMHVTGENTDMHALATVALSGDRHMDLAASGTINMQLAETLDPDLTSSGITTFEVEAHGTVQDPGLRGRIDVKNAAMSLEDLPNGLSQMTGTLEFNQDRLEVRNLTAMSGGGLLSVGGSLTYQHGVYADLTVTGKGVRIRYPAGVSSLADATLRLQGSPTNVLLSGNVLITRFATSPDLDLAAVAAQAGASVNTVALPNAPSNHLRLDIHVVSSPQLNFQNAFAKLAGDVDLRVRGTLASPSLLGQVSITEGSAVIAGTRYDLQRGDISLTNPVRIEPVIDLTATAHVEDYDITLGLHGTPQKLAVSYRSDPPLPESDVVSLLALGHTQDQERLYTQQQEQEFSSPSTDALLGGALNATVSSRVQKLFGAGSVKVDPVYLGAFGNSTSRVTVQEQVGRNLTLTYATDVNTTGQQLLQAEVAINRHVSLVVARDESGVFSMVFKATRRYR